MPRRGQASSRQRGPARVPRRDLRGLRGSGRRSVRAAQRPARLLQHLLRPGSSRDAGRRGGRRLAGRPIVRNPLSSHEAGPATGRPRVMMGPGGGQRGRHHHPGDGWYESSIMERRGSPGGRHGIQDGAQHRHGGGREVHRGGPRRRNRGVPGRGQDRIRVRGLTRLSLAFDGRLRVAANRRVSGAAHDRPHARIPRPH